MSLKPFTRSLVIAACFMMLTGCDNKKAEQPQQSAEQLELLKYNEYINAANMTAESYARELHEYQKYIQPSFEGKSSLKDLFFREPIVMPRIEAMLDKARAMKPAMADLDGPAQAYSEALAKAEPVCRDLYNYISAKTYLSDKGAHGRAIQPAYLSAMKNLVVAQAAYLKGIDAQDRARVKSEFTNAKKDTLAYYKTGMVYYLKASMDAAGDVIDNNGLGENKEAFSKALDQFNSMYSAYDAKIREVNKEGNSSLSSKANDFLAKGRDIIEHTEDGTYKSELKHPKLFRSSVENDMQSFFQSFNNMIGEINLEQG